MKKGEYESFRRQLGQRIKALRLEKGLSQERMDDGKYAISYRTIQDVENLEGDIRLTTLYRIARRLDVDFTDLFKD